MFSSVHLEDKELIDTKKIQNESFVLKVIRLQLSLKPQFNFKAIFLE